MGDACQVITGGSNASDIAGVVIFRHPKADPGQRPISLHVVVPTIGRKSIFRLLDSIAPQLQPQDLVTISFDGQDTSDVFDEVVARLQGMVGSNVALMEGTPAKDSGNSGRDKYRSRGGDFVLFADDDNYYTAEAFNTIRSIVRHDLEAFYIFRTNLTSDGKIVPNPWESATIELGKIDTGCGVTPVRYMPVSDWKSGATYLMDYFFLKRISRHAPRTYFIDYVTYVHSGHNVGKIDIRARRAE